MADRRAELGHAARDRALALPGWKKQAVKQTHFPGIG
jgi:hypothetical protein